jgi:phage I-like protein
MNMMETAAQAAEIAQGGTVPEWVHVLPSGQIEGRDGRRFALPNPAAVVEAFAQNGADLPVDYEHQADNPAAKASGPIPAAGWIKAMKATPEGVFARIEWTDRARGMIAAKEYRYISPVIVYDKDTREVGRISGAGLVHRPNLQLQALNAQDAPGAPMQPQPDPAKPEPVKPDAAQAVTAMLDMLGLTPEATATEVITALLARAAKHQTGTATQGQGGTEVQALGIPDPSRYVEITALNAALESAAQERRAAGEARAKGKIERAIREGFITPGMRKWATALCDQSEAMFDDFCERAGPTFAYLLRPAGIATAHLDLETAHASDPVAVAICEQLGLKPEALGR